MAQQRAAIYTRISNDPEGQRLGVDRQREDCARLAEQRGYEVVATYEDNDIGASTRSATKRRPQYDAMLEAARRREVDVVVSYTTSRLTRRPRENEDLIELAERHGVRFAHVASPEFDLNTSDGRYTARILASGNTAESERIAERVGRAAQQRAEQGKWHGGRVPFGYEAVKDAAGRVTTLRSHAEHAAWVQDAAVRLLAGETRYGICSDWNRKGRRTTAGKAWTPRTLERVVTAPAAAARRETKDGRLFDCGWPPLLTEPTWDRVRTLLASDDRAVRHFPPGNSARKYPLSRLVFCAACRKPMTSQPASKGGPVAFVCSTGKAAGCSSRRIAMAPLQELVVAAFFYRVNSPVLDRLLAGTQRARANVDEQERKVRQEVEQQRVVLDRLLDAFQDGLITKAEYADRSRPARERLVAAEQRLAAMAVQSAQVNVPRGRELDDRWAEGDPIWQNSVLSALIERVDIGPMPKGMTTNLSRRRGESDASHSQRRAANLATVMNERVHTVWRA